MVKFSIVLFAQKNSSAKPLIPTALPSWMDAEIQTFSFVGILKMVVE
jgi:hypothetical protein